MSYVYFQFQNKNDIARRKERRIHNFRSLTAKIFCLLKWANFCARHEFLTQFRQNKIKKARERIVRLLMMMLLNIWTHSPLIWGKMKNLHNHNIVHEVNARIYRGVGKESETVMGNCWHHTHDIINHHEHIIKWSRINIVKN